MRFLLLFEINLFRKQRFVLAARRRSAEKAKKIRFNKVKAKKKRFNKIAKVNKKRFNKTA